MDGDMVYLKAWNTDNLFRKQRSWRAQDSTDFLLIWELANILLSSYRTARIVLTEPKEPKCEQNELKCEQLLLINIYHEKFRLSDWVYVLLRL